MYSDTLLDHLANPRHYGPMKEPDAVGIAKSPRCGEELRIYIKVQDGVIADISFTSEGCGATLGSTSIAVEMMNGKPLNEALQVNARDIERACGGLPEDRIQCAILAQQGLRNAVRKLHEKP